MGDLDFAVVRFRSGGSGFATLLLVKVGMRNTGTTIAWWCRMSARHLGLCLDPGQGIA
jgi:hypothetical protein